MGKKKEMIMNSPYNHAVEAVKHAITNSNALPSNLDDLHKTAKKTLKEVEAKKRKQDLKNFKRPTVTQSFKKRAEHLRQRVQT